MYENFFSYAQFFVKYTTDNSRKIASTAKVIFVKILDFQICVAPIDGLDF